MNDQRPTSLPPLEYASPSDDQLSSGRMLFQAVLACGLTCGLLMGSVFVLTFMAFIGSAGNSAIGVVIAIAVAGLKRPCISTRMSRRPSCASMLIVRGFRKAASISKTSPMT